MPTPIVVASYAHLDWLTLTIPSYSPHYNERTQQWLSLISTETSSGNLVKLAHLNGYTGFTAGKVTFGTRLDGAMLECTGQAAEQYFSAAFGGHCAVTRLDLAVTVRFASENLDIAKEAYENALETNNARPTQTRRKLYIIRGSDGGDTCYLGAPSSAQRGRIYNKDKQSNEEAFKNCWRYEVQLRNELAAQAAQSIVTAQVDRCVVVADMVDRWFLARGVDTAFTADCSFTSLPRTFRRHTDIERKLEWLREQVRPTVHQLIDSGWYNEVYQALALVPPDNEENQAVSQ